MIPDMEIWRLLVFLFLWFYTAFLFYCLLIYAGFVKYPAPLLKAAPATLTIKGYKGEYDGLFRMMKRTFRGG